jgi:hypothetical protein
MTSMLGSLASLREQPWQHELELRLFSWYAVPLIPLDHMKPE